LPIDPARVPVILIVDDDADIRTAFKSALTLEGYEVEEAADGREALEQLRRSPIGLVFLDLMMPGMNGWEFRAEQMRDPALARVPVAVLSGSGLPASKILALEAAAYLRKPPDLDELLNVVERLCPGAAR
jgi:DNA-binding response OmpR family regulator